MTNPVLKNLLTGLLLIVICFFFRASNAQVSPPDSTAIQADSILYGSSEIATGDTLGVSTSSDFRSKVDYAAEDSLIFDAEQQIVYLYGKATVNYENMTLKADFIQVNLSEKTLYSTYLSDSSGSKSGIPDFAQNDDHFTADEIRYNFESKKGKIKGVYTQQGEGYVYGETVKKLDDFEYIHYGTYTTCDLKEPHFAIAANKLKIINNNKIITGPAYLTIAGVPTPLAIPFGYFPNRKGRSSGIIFPAYGESGELGFFLKSGGYYFGLSDYLDLALTGDIYSKGSYGMQSYFRYANRYKYNGNLSLSYSKIRTGEPETPSFNFTKDFFVRWQHAQDPKARPNTIFSSNVNAGSSSYFRNNISSPNNFLTNTFQSSIAYSKTFPGKPYSLSSSINHSQNTQTRDINVTFPNINFSVNRLYPFKKKIAVGSDKWYERIGISYQSNFQNSIQTKDTLLFKDGFGKRFRNGLQHSIPVSTSLKVLKFFTLTPSFSYSEKWYLQTIRKNYVPDEGIILTDTVNGFKAAREFNASASLNTRIYGMFQFRNRKIAAIRHVMSPSLTFSFRPDFSDPFWNYYRQVQSNAEGQTTNYSIFEQAIFGGPGAGRQEIIGFNLDNNLEMKVRKITDTTEVLKKIKVFESLSISGSYNLAADSLQLSPVTLNARTTLFDRLNLNFGSTLDPYITDSLNRRLDQFELSAHNRLARLTSASVSAGFNLTHSPKVKPSDKIQEDEKEYINKHPVEYVDLTVPFSLNVNYSLFYSRPGLQKATITQTINFNGDISLTPKWKIIFSSGYDVQQKQWAYTSLSFYRDLHCWEMRLNWVPLGGFTYWNFQINVKASVLQDLKLTKKNDYYDR